jgi:putative ABC transport system substrate-binding protein
MLRREFIAGLGSAAAWPVVARAQQPERVRRIGVLIPWDENDSVAKTFVSALTQTLAALGWTDGRNVRMDLLGFGDDSNRARALAQELVGLQLDIILAGGTLATAALQREIRTIPIVFATGGDPVASGLAERLDRPSKNITGFATNEASIAGKWLELLFEIVPGLKRAAFMFNPDIAAASAYIPSFETAVRALGECRSIRPAASHTAAVPT